MVAELSAGRPNLPRAGPAAILAGIQLAASLYRRPLLVVGNARSGKAHNLMVVSASEVPPQIHAYLSTNFKDLRNLPKDAPSLRTKAKVRWYVPDPHKAADLEKLRERTLLREFTEYQNADLRRLKVFRLEAIRAGFCHAWQKQDYATIVSVGKKIAASVIQEDPKLLMWLDQATIRQEQAL